MGRSDTIPGSDREGLQRRRPPLRPGKQQRCPPEAPQRLEPCARGVCCCVVVLGKTLRREWERKRRRRQQPRPLKQCSTQSLFWASRAPVCLPQGAWAQCAVIWRWRRQTVERRKICRERGRRGKSPRKSLAPTTADQPLTPRASVPSFPMRAVSTEHDGPSGTCPRRHTCWRRRGALGMGGRCTVIRARGNRRMK